MGHYRHRVHADPFLWPGLADLTAHVDFTAIAEAGERAGLRVAGFASQASFLIGCGILDLLGAVGRARLDRLHARGGGRAEARLAGRDGRAVQGVAARARRCCLSRASPSPTCRIGCERGRLHRLLAARRIRASDTARSARSGRRESARRRPSSFSRLRLSRMRAACPAAASRCSRPNDKSRIGGRRDRIRRRH